MTIEQALYFKIMLICGYSDELYEYIDTALNEQNPVDGILLDLVFCDSNEKKMLSVLESYIGQMNEKTDSDVMIDNVFKFLQNKYSDGETPLKSFVSLMMKISNMVDTYGECSEPWFTMTLFDEFYEDAEKGYIDMDGYIENLNAFLFEKKYYNEFEFYKPIKKQLKTKRYLQTLLNKLKLNR